MGVNNPPKLHDLRLREKLIKNVKTGMILIRLIIPQAELTE